MDAISMLPTKRIVPAGPMGRRFLELGIHEFQEACFFVHRLPYGYNSNRDEAMILFKEGFGTCTTKHATIASLAEELGLNVRKQLGIYAMTEEIVAGTDHLLTEFGLPYIPMSHCFLSHGPYRIDLTEGNRNGKKRSIEEFLYTVNVTPNISDKEEYLIYRKALTEIILLRNELEGVDHKVILRAREKGILLLKANLKA